jgi:hypothetical protein
LRTRSVGEGSATVTDALAAGRAVVTNVGSASELPEGVVERVPVTVEVEELARHVERILLDTRHRELLERNALEFARTHTFADVARAVVDIAASVAEPAFPTPLAVSA